MTDEPTLVQLVRGLGDKIDRLAADQVAIKATVAAANAKLDRVDQKVDRVIARIDRMDAKLDRAAVRADDVMGAQARMAIDIATLRAAHEDDNRTLVEEFRDDMDGLRKRVEVLEAQAQRT